MELLKKIKKFDQKRSSFNILAILPILIREKKELI